MTNKRHIKRHRPLMKTLKTPKKKKRKTKRKGIRKRKTERKKGIRKKGIRKKRIRTKRTKRKKGIRKKRKRTKRKGKKTWRKKRGGAGASDALDTEGVVLLKEGDKERWVPREADIPSLEKFGADADVALEAEDFGERLKIEFNNGVEFLLEAAFRNDGKQRDQRRLDSSEQKILVPKSTKRMVFDYNNLNLSQSQRIDTVAQMANQGVMRGRKDMEIDPEKVKLRAKVRKKALKDWWGHPKKTPRSFPEILKKQQSNREKEEKLKTEKEKKKRRTIHIIGAGPVGLYTAICLEQRRKRDIWAQNVNIIVYEKRDRATSMTRANVIFLNDNPMLKNNIIFTELVKNGLCKVAYPPWILKGAGCKSPGVLGYDSAAPGYTLPINYIQYSLTQVIKNSYKNIEIKYGINFKSYASIYDILKEHDIVIDSSGGRSPIVADLLKDADTIGIAQDIADADAYGLTINFPCGSISSPGVAPWSREDPAAVLQAQQTRQNNYRFLPAYRGNDGTCNLAVPPTDQGQDQGAEPLKYSYYMGLNLSRNQYNYLVEQRKKIADLGRGSFIYTDQIPEEGWGANIRSVINEYLKENNINYSGETVDLLKQPNTKISFFPIHLNTRTRLWWYFPGDEGSPGKKINVFLVGDSIYGVHFFSGSGINTGMTVADKLTDIITEGLKLPINDSEAEDDISSDIKVAQIFNRYNDVYTNEIQDSLEHSCGVLSNEQRGELPDHSICRLWGY